MITRHVQSGRQPTIAIIVLAVVTTLAAYGCHSKSPDIKLPLRLYYVHIGVETLVPVTPDEMEKKGSYCAMNSIQDVREIRQILDESVLSSAKTFSAVSTRVKLIAEDGSLMALIDNYGGIRFADGRNGSISDKNLRDLKQVIESRCGL